MAFLEELGSNVREQCVGEDILVGAVEAFELRGLVAELIPFRLEEVGGTDVDRLLLGLLLGELDDLRVAITQAFAVVAEHEVRELTRHDLVAAHEDVEHSLRADDLRRRGDQRRVTSVGLDLGNLGHDLVDTIACALGVELRFHVGEHAAGDLRGEDVRVNERLRLELLVLRANLLEVVADLDEALGVEAGLVARVLEHFDERLGRVVAGAERHRGDGGVDDVGACLDRLHQRHEGHAGGGVAVDVDLDVAVGFLDALDDVVGGLRLQQCGHVLEGDRFGAHVDELAGELDVALDGVDRGDRVADRALGVLADGLDRLHGAGHVAGVVEGIEDAEDVHAVLGRLLDELLDDHVLVVAVAEEVLPAQQHLQLGIGHQLAERAETFPRILIEEADAGVIGCSAPAFN